MSNERQPHRHSVDQ